MQRLFGRSNPTSGGSSERKGSPPTSDAADAGVLGRISDSKDLIEKREDHLRRKIGHEVSTAIQHKEAGRKAQALACLRTKKLLEEELDGLIQRRLRLETHENALQSLKFCEMTSEVEREATAAIKSRVKRLGGPDKMDERRADADEALEDAYELLGIAREPLAIPSLSGVTDDELWDELTELERMEEEEEEKALGEKLAAVERGKGSSSFSSCSGGPVALPVPTPVALPVPTNQPATSKAQREAAEAAEQERELSQLTASMCIDQPMPMLGRAPPMVSVA